MADVESLSLEQFNWYIGLAGFKEISQAQLDHARALTQPERLDEAALKASDSTNAKTYMKRVMEAIGVRLQAGVPPAAAPSSKPAQARPSQQPVERATTAVVPPPVSTGAPCRTESPTEPDAPLSTSADEGRKEYGLSMHVYGGSAALCFEEDETRGSERKDGVATLQIHAAKATGVRQYNWTNKIIIQLTRNELPIVAAIFLGLMKACEFKSHGPDKDKGFSIDHQVEKIFIKVWRKGMSCAVPVELPDAYHVSTLLMRQLQKNAPWLSAGEVMSLLRGTVANQTEKPTPGGPVRVAQ
ncbi:hypothetical protein [Acidihalobacter aeolianus]|nr:hypothetical protein [Acidihalobacter aeolianus]